MKSADEKVRTTWGFYEGPVPLLPRHTGKEQGKPFEAGGQTVEADVGLHVKSMCVENSAPLELR